MIWKSIPMDEQETIINFDYYERILKIYTSRSVVYKKLQKKIGDPIKVYFCNNQMTCADWHIPFSDRKTISKALTLANLLMTKDKVKS